VRKRLKANKAKVDSAYIQMGRDLYLAFHRRFYQKWGYDTFTDYVEQEVGIAKTRAERLRRIWTKFVKQLKVAPAELAGVGFTNAFTMLPVVDSTNVYDWIDEAKNKSWRELDLAVRAAKGPSKAAADSITASTPKTPKAAPTAADDPTYEDDGSETPTDTKDARRPWTFRLYPSQFKVVDAAVAEARRTKPDEMAENEALAHVATEFLASRMSKEEKPLVRLKFMLSVFESVYGGKFVWIKNEDAAQFLGDAMDQRPDLFNQPTE
jgi:hypothetical protein